LTIYLNVGIRFWCIFGDQLERRLNRVMRCR